MQRKFTFLVAGFTCLFCYIVHPIIGQERTPIRDSLYSSLLQETRIIEVLLPKNYKAGSSDKYGVVYKLDGEWDKWLIPGSYDFAIGAGFVPENIFVRIPNSSKSGINLRDRDLTPTRVNNYTLVNGSPISGGADTFRAFLKNELIPYINNKYPSNGENTLVGGSLAGLFTIYTLLKEPHLFKSYVAVEPAMHWDNRYVNKLALETLEQLPDLQNTTLWIAGRAGNAYEYMGIAQLDSILQKKAPKGLLWKSAAYPNETHYSAQYKGYYDGFKFIYTGYVKAIDVHPTQGILLKDHPLPIMVIQEDDSTSLRYTTDGSVPTPTSKKVHYFIPLSGTSVLKVKSFSNRSSYDKLVSASFQEGEALSTSVKPKGGKTKGLQYKYYEGTWDKLPELAKVQPVKSGPITEHFKFSNISSGTASAYVIDGQVEIPEEGYYIFFIESAQAAKLSIAGKPIMDVDSVETNGKYSYVLPLKKGIYSLQLELLQTKGTGDLHFTVFQSRRHTKDEWWRNTFLRF